MPQTIALQRGTTTVTANSTSAVTLFTQSGGLATRVIVNQLAVSFSDLVDETQTTVGVYHESSGGQTSLIGLFRRTDATSIRALQFPVGAFTNNNWGGTPFPSSSEYSNQLPIIFQGSTAGDMFSSNPNSIQAVYSNPTHLRFAVLPSNFYIGPNDSIRIKIRGFNTSSGATTATISYSFTTITET